MRQVKFIDQRVIIIEYFVVIGGLNEEIDKLLENCRTHETVFCFGLRRRKLGYYAHGNGLVSCIGISNYANAEVSDQV